MAVFSPTNAKVHFKAYDGSFTDFLGNTAITQNNGVAMSSAQKLFGQQSMYMASFSDSITFNTPSVFDVGTGDYTVGFWFHPTQFTSYDRLFATGPDSGGNPLRIYNHNGSIQVYLEDDDESPGDAAHDLLFSYYLGAGATNKWWHIMVQRNSGTTRLYVNGTEQRSSTVSYEIDNSSSPTLGADINAAATGVKGYIQDFFWTDEAVSFDQADFTPASAEPITFHTGVPSNVSITPSANSVAQAGDSVTLSWSVSGETKLELLKYVGGILSSTEDVLGLSSKTVAITETVSYKLRATNDNSAVDSASVQITLNGGNNMPKIAVADVQGLVLQKSMVDSGGGLADVMHAEDPTNGSAEDKLNLVLSNMHQSQGAMSASIDARISADEDALAAEVTARGAADSSLELRLSNEEDALAAEIAATDAEMSSMETRVGDEEAARAAADASLTTRVAAEEAARSAADGSLETRLGDEEAARAAADGSLTTRVLAAEDAIVVETNERKAADSSLELRLSNDEDALAAEIAATNSDVSSVDVRVGAEEVARAAADSSLELRLSNEEDALAAEIAATDAEVSSIETRVAAEEVRAGNAEASLEVRFNDDVNSIDTRVVGVESDLNTEITARGAADSSLELRLSNEEDALAAEIAATDADFVSSDARVGAEEVARAAADSSLETRLGDEESARAAADSSLELRLSNEEDALAAEIAATNSDVGSIDTRVAAEEVARAAADSSLETRLGDEEVARAAADSSLELRLSNEEDALAAEIAATNADVGSIDTRVAADEAALAAHIADFAWDGVDTMIIGGLAKFEFETGLNAGDPMKVTITKK